MRKLFQPHLPGTNNQNLYDIPFGYLSIIFRNQVKLRHKKTGGIWPPVIQRILKDYATSSYCGTGLRKLLVTHAR